MTGTVRDASGAGAGGVLVGLYAAPGRGGVEYAEAETDKDGGFKMTVEFNRSPPSFISFSTDFTCFLIARDIGRNLAVMEKIVSVPGHMDLTLQPGFRLSTVIKDVNGAPLRGIPVDLVWEPDNRHYKLKPEVTDGEGRVSFAGLPRGCGYFILNEDCPPGYGTVSASLTTTLRTWRRPGCRSGLIVASRARTWAARRHLRRSGAPRRGRRRRLRTVKLRFDDVAESPCPVCT